MCRSAFLYVFGIIFHVPNTFLVLQNLLVFSTQYKRGENSPILTFLGARSKRQEILANT